MITSSPAMLMLSLGVGLIVGALFFAGLWYTVQRLALAKHPAAIVLFSAIVRVAIVLGAFFLVGRGHIDRMLVCLLGFLLARFIVIRVTKNRTPIESQPGKEGASASQS